MEVFDLNPSRMSLFTLGVIERLAVEICGPQIKLLQLGMSPMNFDSPRCDWMEGDVIQA